MTLISLPPSLFFSLFRRCDLFFSLLPEGNFYEDQSVVWGLLETHPNTTTEIKTSLIMTLKSLCTFLQKHPVNFCGIESKRCSPLCTVFPIELLLLGCPFTQELKWIENRTALQTFLRYKGSMGIAMEPRVDKIRNRDHESRSHILFLKKIPFILYSSLHFSPFPVLLRQALIATDFKYSLYYSAVCFFPPFRRWPGSHHFLQFQHLAKWNQTNFHFQIRWDLVMLRSNMFYSHRDFIVDSGFSHIQAIWLNFNSLQACIYSSKGEN